MDTVSREFGQKFGELAFLALSVWLIYRIVKALKTGELYTRGRYELEGHLYSRESEPYMFWQTIVMWILGVIALWVMFYLVVTGAIPFNTRH